MRMARGSSGSRSSSSSSSHRKPEKPALSWTRVFLALAGLTWTLLQLCTYSRSVVVVTTPSPAATSITHHNGNDNDHRFVATPTTTTARQQKQHQDHHLLPLPTWITDYITWHTAMRTEFPGRSLWTDPDAPPLLIRTCLGLCGGLHDRLGQLPWDVYLANQTGRLLLLHWHRPVPLEHFVQPNMLDWRVPEGIEGYFPSKQKEVRVSRQGMKVVRAVPQLFEGLAGDETRPEGVFWNTSVDEAIARATVGSMKDIKVLRHRILGHVNEFALEERLRALGETDMLHGTQSFGNLFWIFFRPSDGVQMQLDQVYHDLQIRPGEYSGIHCRVRHPKATPVALNVKGKNEDYTADKTGLPWEGETRSYAIATATRALQCAKRYFAKSEQDTEPIYFFSDSNDLVEYMAHELSNATLVQKRSALYAESSTDQAALEAVRSTAARPKEAPSDTTMGSYSLVARRDMYKENTHIDKQKGRDPPAYYTTFIDLFLATNARCLAYGVGFYAVFASKISGTVCKVMYQEETWGGLKSKKEKVQQCVLPSDK